MTATLLFFVILYKPCCRHLQHSLRSVRSVGCRARHHNGPVEPVVLAAGDEAGVQQGDGVANRTLFSLDALLGTMLEFVPASDAEAWAIVPVTSVHDVWKLEDDVRKRGRYFVNQFVGAYRPTEDAADEDAADDAVDEAA